MHTQGPHTKRFDIKKILAWLSKHQLAAALIAGATIVALVFITALALLPVTDESSVTYNPLKRPVKYFSPLTGREVPSESLVKEPVTAVMIENSPDARPQSGLKDVGVAYEAVAEGGITRFIALYQESKPELIGPVRSLRIYYLDWAAPYQASIAHVGGSYNALQEVRNGTHRDIDQFYNADAYWRASDRYAPHNVYTSAERLSQLNKDKGYTSSSFESFKRADGKPSEAPNATAITMDFSSPIYNTSYAYDPSSNTYARSIAGAPHADREKGQITPNVVVALRVSAQSRGGSDGYEDIVTSGSGTAYVFQNGTVSEVTWKKEDRMSPLRLTNSEGENVVLNRGQTWIGAITERGNVSWQ